VATGTQKATDRRCVRPFGPIGFLHEFFALPISHLFNAPVQNSRGDHQEGDKPNGAASNKFMPDQSSSASTASGMNEARMESMIAQITAWSFALLTVIMLGLTVINHL
jgi:hypothetical protein